MIIPAIVYKINHKIDMMKQKAKSCFTILKQRVGMNVFKKAKSIAMIIINKKDIIKITKYSIFFKAKKNLAFISFYLEKNPK